MGAEGGVLRLLNVFDVLLSITVSVETIPRSAAQRDGRIQGLEGIIVLEVLIDKEYLLRITIMPSISG